jgi:glycerol-3-phosphate dehydrogenase
VSVWQAGRVATLTAGSFRRDDALRRLRDERFDVLVIGGGITGAGVALDAAARGLHTALVERDDFASGTSSKSSKLVHGGLRYLQQREFRLVYEGLRERQRLLENASHLVTRLPFLIPIFGKDNVLSASVARTFATALWLYDVTGGVRIGHRHQRLSREQALAHLPTLNADRLVTGFLYFDARADDARLTLTIARTAALDFGAAIANHTAVSGLLRNANGKIVGARVRPALPGQAPAEEIEVQATVVVNATGVWADDIRTLDEGAHPHSLRPAKGIHITVPRSKFPTDIAAVLPTADRRSIFVVPWVDGEDVYLGTTDTDWQGSLDDPACLPEDVDYILEAANAAVTDPLTRDDVRGVWAGLRPLLAPPPGARVRARTADLSRRHTVRVSEDGMVTVTGGKLTTYRLMAEDAVHAVLPLLGSAAPRRALHCPTRDLVLHGGDPQRVAELRHPTTASELGLDQTLLGALVTRHGTESLDVLALADGDPTLLNPLLPDLPYLRVEALWAARNEMAMTVEDVLSRRTRALVRQGEATATVAPGLAEELAAEWGNSPEEARSVADAFATRARSELLRAGLTLRAPAESPAPGGRTGRRPSSATRATKTRSTTKRAGTSRSRNDNPQQEPQT